MITVNLLGKMIFGHSGGLSMQGYVDWFFWNFFTTINKVESTLL